jgi:F0F1-type ATP synthase epsilon subunit
MRRSDSYSILYGIVSLLSFLSISYGIFEWYNLESQEIQRVVEEARSAESDAREEARLEREKRESAEKKAKKEKKKRKQAERELEEERLRVSKDRWRVDGDITYSDEDFE